MKYRRLGASGLKVSEVCLGSWLTFGGATENEIAEKCIDRAYELGVNAYLVKPHAFSKLVEVLRRTTNFWRDTAAHPRI